MSSKSKNRPRRAPVSIPLAGREMGAGGKAVVQPGVDLSFANHDDYVRWVASHHARGFEEAQTVVRQGLLRATLELKAPEAEALLIHINDALQGGWEPGSETFIRAVKALRYIMGLEATMPAFDGVEPEVPPVADAPGPNEPVVVAQPPFLEDSHETIVGAVIPGAPVPGVAP